MFRLVDDDESTVNISQRGTPNPKPRFRLVEDEEEPKAAAQPQVDKIFQQYQVPEKTKEELKNMSSTERRQYAEDINRQAEYLRSAGFTKGLLSGATFGASENIEELKPQSYESLGGLGEFIGSSAPIGGIYKGLGVGFKALGNLFNFGNKAKFALQTAHEALTGLSYGSGKEAVKAAEGKEFDIKEPLKEAAFFAAAPLVIKGIMKGGAASRDWIKSLSTEQQTELLSKGILPDNLTPKQYKFWEQEVAPEWIENTKSIYDSELKKATEQANNSYKQELQIAKANHERDLYEAQQKNILNEEKYNEYKRQYENEVNEKRVKHEEKIQEINEANDMSLKEYQESLQSFNELKARQDAVAEATILKPNERELPYKKSSSLEEKPSLENEVGNVVSPNEITNTTNAGKANIEAVRANDSIDYAHVNDLYKKSRELNSNIELIQPNLVMDLGIEKKRLMQIPKLDPVQEQKLTFINEILGKTAEFGPNGSIVKLIPINNQILLDQAQSIRYFMDYTFEHGNPRGMLSPLQRQLETAAETAANFTGNVEASNANKLARSTYAEWAKDYDNSYIRPYRDTTNQDFSKIFKSSLDLDEYKVLDNILSRSNQGQQLSQVTKRALVEKHLSKFLEIPQTTSSAEFNKTLNELSSVLSPEETSSIRESFTAAREKPISVSKRPEIPELKKHPRPPTIPSMKSKPTEKVVTEAKIPLKERVKETPEMKIAATEMHMTPEKIRDMADTVSGLKKLKERLSKDVYEKIGKEKTREIIYGGEFRKKITGSDLKKTFNKEKNHEILTEILGEDEVSTLLDAFEKIADKEATKENIIKFAKTTGKVKTFLFLSGL